MEKHSSGATLSRATTTYWMVDSVQGMTQYKLLEGFLMLAGTGYIVKGPLEFGPYFRAFSRNAIEGNPYSLGVQTSNDFSRKVWLRSFLAYGTLDQRWKYGASASWVLNKSPRTEAFFEHTRDIDQLGMMGFFDQGNGLNSALQLNEQTRLSEVTRTEMSVLHEFGSGWGQSVEFRHRSVAPRGEVLFVRESDSTGTSPLVTAELTIQTRYARNEKFVSGAFERVSLGSKFPVLTGTVTLASEHRQKREAIPTLDADAEAKRLGPLGRLEWGGRRECIQGGPPSC